MVKPYVLLEQRKKVTVMKPLGLEIHSAGGDVLVV
jgi:hypothetical protein